MEKEESRKIRGHQFEELSNQIIGAAIRVHKELGPGPTHLKATGMKVGLLLNFSKPTLEVRRVVN